MAKSEIQNIPSMLTALARQTRVLIVSASPQPNLKSGVANLVPVDLVATGRFPDFRVFLLSMATFPGFDSVSHLEITREAGRERLELRMWVVVE